MERSNSTRPSMTRRIWRRTSTKLWTYQLIVLTKNIQLTLYLFSDLYSYNKPYNDMEISTITFLQKYQWRGGSNLPEKLIHTLFAEQSPELAKSQVLYLQSCLQKYPWKCSQHAAQGASDTIRKQSPPIKCCCIWSIKEQQKIQISVQPGFNPITWKMALVGK